MLSRPDNHPITILQALFPGSFPEPEKETFPEGLWDSERAAAYVGVHVETLRKWVRLGTFPRIPLPGSGKDLRFSKELIDRWSEERALNAKTTH
jgi:excisionase family DNA binding protein